MIKYLAFLFLAYIALVNCQNFGGIWEVPAGFNISFCESGGMVHGRGDRVFLYLNILSTTSAKGKYFFIGDKYTGSRATYANFYAARGRIELNYDADTDSITATDAPKGLFGFTDSFSMTRVSTSIGSDDDVWTCAIIDRASAATVNGYWLSNDKSAITAHLCVTGRRLEGSYTFHFNYDGSDIILPGYYIGYCALNGMICGGVYYQNDVNYETYTTFGAETAVRLSDDRLLLAHTRGAPGIHAWEYKIGVNQLDRQATSTTECSTYVSSYFNPVKCKKLSLELCAELDGYGFCELNNASGTCDRVAVETA